MAFTRITAEPEKMGGIPCIRGLRIPVATVVGMVANGMSIDEILAEYPDLERDDVREALAFTPINQAEHALGVNRLKNAFPVKIELRG